MLLGYKDMLVGDGRVMYAYYEKFKACRYEMIRVPLIV